MRTLVFSSLLASAAVAACYTGADVAPDTVGGGGASATDSTTPVVGDLPCDVAPIVASSCATCHGDPLSGGAPSRLLTQEDFAAPSKADPSINEAQLALQRMKNTAMPMPPSGALPAAQIATFEAWVSAGLPKGTCSAGSSAAGPAVCTSNQTWRGDEGRGMDPGRACISCHSGSREAPRFTIAGTVYATAHEPDNCLGGVGAAAGTSVVITDANGTDHTVAVGASGNFTLSTSIAVPYKAKVVGASGAVRAMSASQTSGDCNSCHTQNGANGAPGRVFAP